MKKLAPFTFALLILTGCNTAKTSVSIKQELQNPLYAERYAEEMVQALVELKIQQDPILEDNTKAAYIEKNRSEWLEVAKKARATQREGRSGNFVPVNEYVAGETLFVDSTLYFGPQFEVLPMPSVEVYFTTEVNPKNIEFPDSTAIKLGSLGSAYGSHQYEVPKLEDPILYRTVVLYEPKLERIIGFAQLSTILEKQ